jgi:Tfp pilus assembly PilM family ATPase
MGLGFLKNCAYPIGVDTSNDALKLAQLGDDGTGIGLIACESTPLPTDIEPGSSDWQRWAAATISELTATGKFRGRNAVVAMPANDVFVDHVTMPKAEGADRAGKKLHEAVLSRVRHKLPFEPDGTMIRSIHTIDDNFLVVAIEREKIDRHLAIYEKANLQVKSMGIWPTAMTNSYVTLFSACDKADLGEISMLVSIEKSSTNVVVCRHRDLLFAHSISTGAKRLDDDAMVTKLVLELAACRGKFEFMYGKTGVERLVFLTTYRYAEEHRAICTAIARELELPAQMGDCLAAVAKSGSCDLVAEGSDYSFNWTTALGLSLS